MICGSGGSKSRLAKAAGAEPAGQMRDEKVHAVVARSTFASQNVQNTPWSDQVKLPTIWRDEKQSREEAERRERLEERRSEEKESEERRCRCAKR